MTLLLSAFMLQAQAAAVKNPDAYVYLDSHEPDTLDPAWPIELVSRGVTDNVYETLFVFDPASPDRLLAKIAAKVPTRRNGLISDDGRRYTIPIRRGVFFHDGAALTPEDVRYSLLRFMLQDRAGGPSAQLLQPLLGYASTRDAEGRPLDRAFSDAARAVSVEGGAVVLRLPAPFAPLLALLATRAPVVSKAWAAAHGDWDGTEATWKRFNNPAKESSAFFAAEDGTGPFALERWDRTARQVVLKRSERYWGPKAKLARAVLRTVPEFATRKLAIAAGDADGIAADVGSYSQLQGLPGVRVDDRLPRPALEPVAYFTFSINPTGNPNIGSGKLDGAGIPPDFFADRDVRLGFAYAFDYDAFARDVYLGRAVQATGFVPRGILGHNPGQPTFSYDPQKARKHFQRAWGGKAWANGFKLNLTYNSGNGSRQTLCQILKSGLESLNPKFQVDVRGIDWPAYLDAGTARKLPVMLLNLSANYPDPHSFAFEAMDSRGDSGRRQGYRNAEVDRLIDAAIRETSPERRRTLYAKLQKIEHDDVPHLLFIEAPVFRVYRSWLKGVVYDPTSLYAPLASLYKGTR